MEREQATRFIHELLQLLVKEKGSDLFITADFPPAIKVDGKITPVSKTAMTPQHTIELVRSVMNDKQASELESTKECNFAISPPGLGRFRVNAFVQQSRVGMVFRTITTDIPKFDDLGLPSVLFGVGLPDENAHAPNEKLDLGNFHGGIIASAFLYDEIAKG
jgi:twitching motility protein PilU